MRLQLDDALLQLADPELELLDELTECAILGLKLDVAPSCRLIAVGGPFRTPSPPATVSEARSARRERDARA